MLAFLCTLPIRSVLTFPLHGLSNACVNNYVFDFRLRQTNKFTNFLILSCMLSIFRRIQRARKIRYCKQTLNYKTCTHIHLSRTEPSTVNRKWISNVQSFSVYFFLFCFFFYFSLVNALSIRFRSLQCMIFVLLPVRTIKRKLNRFSPFKNVLVYENCARYKCYA